MRSEMSRRGGCVPVRMASIAASCVLAASVGGQAFGGPSEPPSPAGPTIVVAGGFGCQLQMYPVYQVPLPNDDPIEYATRLSTSIGFSATGGVVPLTGPGTGAGVSLGPGFGGVGRGGRPIVLTPPPTSGGVGVGGSFDGGTIEDCKQFAETIRAAARRLGCAASKVNVNSPIQVYGGGAGVSFVCEAPADAAIHAIGELDRVVLSLELGLRE